MNIKIISLKKEDIPLVAKLVKRSYDITIRSSNIYPETLLNYYINTDYVSTFTKKFEAKSVIYYVAKKDDNIVGMIGLQTDDKDEYSCYISAFYVDPDYLNQGIGKKLYEMFDKDSKLRGFRKQKTKSTIYAEKIYEKLGFKRIGEIKRQKLGCTHINILMEKII